MPLRITDPQSQVGVLNKWADSVDSRLNDVGITVNAVPSSSKVTTIATDVVTNLVLTPPPNPTGINVSENGLLVDSVIYSEVTVTYFAPADISNFAGVYLVTSGYSGTAALVKVAEHNFTGVGGGSDSFKVLLNRTNETVTFYAVAKNFSGITQDSWAAAPSATVVLDGNASAPTAPTGLGASSQPTSVGLVWNENIESNVKAYNVFRNVINNFGSATNVGSAAATGIGSVSHDDKNVTPGTTYFYWVTAVNTSGLQSAASAVASNAPGVLTQSINVGWVTSNPTTTNAVGYVDLPDMTTTIVTTGGKVLFLFSGAFSSSGTTFNPIWAKVQRDGSDLAETSMNITNIITSALPVTVVDSPPAGTHTYKMQWKVGPVSGSVTATAGQRFLQAVELKY